MQKNILFLTIGSLFIIIHLTGCAAPSVTIDIKDQQAYSPSMRLSYNLLPATEQSKAICQTTSLEVDTSYVQGKASQTLTGTDHIILGNTTFTAPAKIDSSFNIFNAMLGVRYGILIKEMLGAELLGGAFGMNSNIELQSGSISQGKSMFNYGPYIGGKLSFMPIDNLKLYGRHITNLSLFDDFQWTSDELGLAFKAHRNIALFAGWRWLDITHDKIIDSDIHMKVSGPMAGLEFTF